MHQPWTRIPLLGALALAVTFGGCLGASKPARFYVLSAEAEPSAPPAQDPLVVVGPFAMPAYLNRPHFVTRLEDGELELDEFARWAEPLAGNVHQVLADNVAALTGSQRVIPSLTLRPASEGYRAMGIVSRFEADGSGDVVLHVSWTVAPPGAGETGPGHRSVYSEPASPRDYGERVRAMNRLLLRFSRDIAAALPASGSP
jgi:uncharacterized lipoprotein YmbA